MNTDSPNVIVVGAGIVGAALACHLARRGARVTLLDKGAPACGVTGRAFAWINVSHGIPEPYSKLRHAAIEDWRRLDEDLGGKLAIDWCGALTWSGDRAATERFARAHAANGYDVRLMERAAIAALEPRLARPPELAVFAASEGAVDAAAAAGVLVGAARDAGAAVRAGVAVESVMAEGGRVTGVRTGEGVVEADVVVVAAGTGSAGLCAALGVTLPVAASPAILLRFANPGRLVDTIISCPEMEIRQASETCLLAVEDYIDDGAENGPEAVARRAREAIGRHLRGADALRLEAVSVGYRPIPQDGLPIAGFSAEVEGLYVAVMHAGVTLAPVIGRLAAGEILDGVEAEMLDTCRPARFGV